MKIWIAAIILSFATLANAQVTIDDNPTDQTKQADKLKNGTLHVPGYGDLNRKIYFYNYLTQDGDSYKLQEDIQPWHFIPDSIKFTDEENELAKGIKIHGRDIEIPRTKVGDTYDWLDDVLFSGSHADRVWQRIEFPNEINIEYKKPFWSMVQKAYLARCIEKAYWDHMKRPKYDKGSKFFKSPNKVGADVESFKKTLAILKARAVE